MSFRWIGFSAWFVLFSWKKCLLYCCSKVSIVTNAMAKPFTPCSIKQDVVNIDTLLYYITVKVYIKSSLISGPTLYTQHNLQPRHNQCSEVSERRREWIENWWGVGRSFILVSHIKPKAAKEKSIWPKKIYRQVVSHWHWGWGHETSTASLGHGTVK